MSEVLTRPGATRGRGSARGGRGGHSNRGGRSSARTNGDKADHADSQSTLDEEADIIRLRKLYGSKVGPIQDMFQGWSDADILYALQETDGDENLAVERIAHGSVSQWGEVSKTKKSSRAKTKDAATPSTAPDSHSGTSRPARGGRNVSESGRGRGRGSERGGRATRGRSTQPATNGSRNNTNVSVPTEESSAWGASSKGGAWGDFGETTKETVEKEKAITTPEPAKPAAAPAAAAAPQAKTWASMLRQSTAPKTVSKPKEAAPVQKPAEAMEPLPPAESAAAEPEPPAPEPIAEETSEEKPDEEVPTIVEPEVALPPSKDQLTETNLEQVADVSKPTATETAASTAADSWDPRLSTAGTMGTPVSASQQQHQAPRPAVPAVPAASSSGFAATAIKATTGRSQSYQRRILDQEEAVRMPANRDMEKTTVQFGAFNLGDGDDDIDGDREEPETRAQPPEESPISHPRASLPPAQPAPAVPEAFAAQKTAAPAAPSAAAPPAAAPTAPAAQGPPAQQTPSTVPTQPAAQQSQPFGRFPQSGGPDGSAFTTFNQQGPSAAVSSQQQQFDNFQSQQTQPPSQPSAPAFSSAPNDYPSYYTADAQNRGPYNNFYGQQYAQQQQGAQSQEGLAAQQQPQQQPQRSFSGYNNASQADNLSQYPQSGQLHNPTRFGVSVESQNSGHTTPNPPAQAQQGQQAQQAQQQGAAQGSQPQAHGQQQSYSYSHPYYNHPFYNQYYQQGAYGQGAYGGAPYGAKGQMYPYNMPPQGPFDHSSSPAAAGFGQQSSLHRDSSTLGGGLGEYGRAGAQSQTGITGSSFGGAATMDAFGRAGFNQSQAAGTASSANDELKPYGESKGAAGPSPSLGGGARPGSAANNAPAGQGGLPPQSASQMGYGGYPSHLQQGLHGNSAYGMGASGGQHGTSPYGSYNQSNFGSAYYGGQQQRQGGGWGGNYNH